MAGSVTDADACAGGGGGGGGGCGNVCNGLGCDAFRYVRQCCPDTTVCDAVGGGEMLGTGLGGGGMIGHV